MYFVATLTPIFLPFRARGPICGLYRAIGIANLACWILQKSREGGRSRGGGVSQIFGPARINLEDFAGDFWGHFFPQKWREKIWQQNHRKNPAATKKNREKSVLPKADPKNLVANLLRQICTKLPVFPLTLQPLLFWTKQGKHRKKEGLFSSRNP